jgi:hypothetical protein
MDYSLLLSHESIGAGREDEMETYPAQIAVLLELLSSLPSAPSLEVLFRNCDRKDV